MTPEKWRRIDEFFQAATEKSPTERADFLAGIPGDIRDEVASLVAAHGDAAAFLSMPHLFETPRALPYSKIAPYRIDREIGSGGVEIVYAASRADRQFEQRVALKVVRAGLGSEPILARFRTERQILATLDHPNIARLLDAGVTPDGRPYLVTELIEGVPLDEYCSSRRLSINARLDLCGKVCTAMQHAHQRLVIHRDLKPLAETFVRTTLSGADPINNSPFADKGRDLRVADALDVAAARTRSELKSQPILAVELLRELGIDYLHLGLYDAAEHVVREALTAEETALGQNDPATELTNSTLSEIQEHKTLR